MSDKKSKNAIDLSNATALFEGSGKVARKTSGGASESTPSPLISILYSLPDLFTNLLLSIRDLKYANDVMLQRYHQWMVQLQAYCSETYDEGTWQYVEQCRPPHSGELVLSLQSALREAEELKSSLNSDKYVRAIQSKVTDRLFMLKRCSTELAKAAEDTVVATWHATHRDQRQKVFDEYIGKLSQFHTQCQTKFGPAHQALLLFIVSIMGDVAVLWNIAVALEQDAATPTGNDVMTATEAGGSSARSPGIPRHHAGGDNPRVNASPISSRETSSIISFMTASPTLSKKPTKAETELLTRVSAIREGVEGHLRAAQRTLAQFLAVADALRQLSYTDCVYAFAHARHSVKPADAIVKPTTANEFISEELHLTVRAALAQLEMSSSDARQNWYSALLDDRVVKTLTRSFRCNGGRRPKSGEALERPSSTMWATTDDTFNTSVHAWNNKGDSSDSGELPIAITPTKKYKDGKRLSACKVLEAEVRKSKSSKRCKALAAALCEEAWFTFAELNNELYNIVLQNMSTCVE